MLGDRGRDLVALGHEACQIDVEAFRRLRREETSIRTANSPPRRTIRLVVTFPPRASKSPGDLANDSNPVGAG